MFAFTGLVFRLRQLSFFQQPRLRATLVKLALNNKHIFSYDLNFEKKTVLCLNLN